MPCFFQRKRGLQESCDIPQVHFRCVFLGTMRLGFTSQGKTRLGGMTRKFLRWKERDMLTMRVSRGKKSDAAASTWAKDPQAPKKNQLPTEDMWKRRVVNKHHQYSCCRQKHVFTYVVGGRVVMNETCYFTFNMKKLDPNPHPRPPVRP